MPLSDADIKKLIADALAPVNARLDAAGIPAAAVEAPEPVVIRLSSDTPTTFDFGGDVVRHGWAAAHVYDRPGTYSVNGKPVVVDAVTRPTVYLSPAAGDDAGDGTRARPVRTAARAAKLLPAGGTLLIQGGDTLALADSIRLKGGRLGSYGDGKATLTLAYGNGIGEFVVASDAIVERIVFATLDAPSGTKDKPDYPQTKMPKGVYGDGNTIRDCVFDTVGYGAEGNRLLMLRCTAPRTDSLRGYGLFGNGLIYDCTFPNSTQEHDLRLFGDNVSVEGNTLANIAGVGSSDIAKPCVTIQQGRRVYVGGNTCKSGLIVVGPLAAPISAAESVTDAILAGNDCAGFEIKPGASRITITGNTIVEPYGDMGINIVPYDATYKRVVSDVTIDRNTVRQSKPYGTAIRVGPGSVGIAISNTIDEAPNRVLGLYDSAAVSYDGTGVTFGSGNEWSAGKPANAKFVGKSPIFVANKGYAVAGANK